MVKRPRRCHRGGTEAPPDASLCVCVCEMGGINCQHVAPGTPACVFQLIMSCRAADGGFLQTRRYILPDARTDKYSHQHCFTTGARKLCRSSATLSNL